MKVSKKRAPTRKIEQELWGRGHETVVGIDEVGRGAWAGPLMVGAAVLPRDTRVNGVRDSKLLTEPEREQLFDHLEKTKDPRVIGGPVNWDYYPYYGRINTKDWSVDPKPE